jgi:hypothetical protein
VPLITQLLNTTFIVYKQYQGKAVFSWRMFKIWQHFKISLTNEQFSLFLQNNEKSKKLKSALAALKLTKHESQKHKKS